MAISIKFTKFDNTPWGFRLAGGSDFPQPLTVIRVTEGSLAECMGLKVGDVVVRLNDQPISSLTHGQAHEELMRAGNNFVLGVLRQEDFVKAAEALSEENIVPYKIPLADLPPVFPEQILKEETVIERHEYEIKTCEEEEGSKQEVEPLPEKPKDANSEIVPNQNLTDDEIAQLILEEEELLDDKGVLGVNFKKLRPRVTVLKQSKVIEELQNIATAEPPLVEQLRRTSVFLQKPERPIPTPRKKEGEQEKETESYKVVIKKQKRRSVTDRLLERGLLKPEGGSTPEPFTPEVNMENKTEGAEKIEEEEEEEEDSSILDASTCLPLDDDPRVSGRSVQGIPRSILENRHDRPSLSFERETRAYETDGATAKGYREEKVARTRGEGKGRRKVSKRGSRTSARVRFPRCLSFAKWRHVGRAVEAKGGKSRLGRGIEVSRVPTSRRIAKKCSKRRRIGGRHLETYLKREDNWTTRRMVDGTFGRRSEARGCFPPVESKGEISWRKSDRVEGTLVRGIELVVARLRPYLLSNQRYFDERSRERSLYFKGRYVRRIFRRDACSLNRIRDAALSLKRNLGSREIRSTRGGNSWRIETRGYWTWYLALFGRFSTRPTSRKKFVSRARYVERILKRQFESLGLIGNHARCQLLQLLRSAAGSSAVIPGFSSLNSRQSDASSLSSVREGSVLSNLIRSSKDYISAEIFHRGSRRSSSRSRSRASSGVSSNLFHGFRTFLRVDRSLPDKRFGEGRGRMSSDKEKMAEDNDRDGRRLSFVPTILYESLTNRIGVDFTRFVAYAFVPCTSLILLYMYK